MAKRSALKPSSTSRPPSKPQGSKDTQSGEKVPTRDKAHQQKLLNLFSNTFRPVLSSGNFFNTLQQVKSALFNRDFEKAFGNEEYLEAYAARWSPTRALCYSSALDGISTHLDKLCEPVSALTEKTGGEHDKDDDQGHELAGVLKVLAIGGAAAETAAFGMYLSRQPAGVSGAITLLDIAPWAGVVEKLRAGLTTPPPLSTYTSAASQAANSPPISPKRLEHVTFAQHDVLSLGKDELSSLAGSGSGSKQWPVLITMFFTLNELFTAGGIGKTTTFLLSLTETVSTGSLLLVIDSPGSYSETTVGKESKRYPMQWLLDKILLGTDAWEKIQSQDSVWFRLPNDLKYPIALEDMRYQMHLYRSTT